MKLIINGFFDNPSLNQVFINILQEFNVSKCYAFTCFDPKTLDLPFLTDIVFYDFQQAITGNYDDVTWNDITPLDANIISDMTSCEVTVLKMMDRLSTVLPTYEERKRMYLRHLRYWNHIITNENISLFLAGNIPHEIYDFIIYRLCKLKNIPTLCISHSAIDGVSFITEDWNKEPSESIAKIYKQIISQQPNKIVLSERFINHYIRQTSKEKDPIPWYMDSISHTPFIIKDL